MSNQACSVSVAKTIVPVQRKGASSIVRLTTHLNALGWPLSGYYVAVESFSESNRMSDRIVIRRVEV